MSTSDGPVEPAPESAAPEPAWERRRRMAAIFGDVLPETTSDERAESREDSASDAWLRSQVPPHHG